VQAVDRIEPELLRDSSLTHPKGPVRSFGFDASCWHPASRTSLDGQFRRPYFGKPRDRQRILPVKTPGLLPWPLRGSEAFELESKEVGDTMAVGVWQPEPQILAAFGRSADEKLDVVYVLDGSWALGVAATVCTLQLADLVRPGFPPL